MKFILQDCVTREIVIEAVSREEAIEKYKRGLIPDKDWDIWDPDLQYIEELQEEG